MFLLIYCISHISGYTCKQWIWMDKHILWKIKPWFSIAFVKLTILEIWIKYWFLSKYEQLKHWVSEALLFSNNFWFFWLNHQNTFPKDRPFSVYFCFSKGFIINSLFIFHQFQNFLQFPPCCIWKKNTYHTTLFEVCIALIKKVHFYVKNIHPNLQLPPMAIFIVPNYKNLASWASNSYKLWVPYT